MRLSWLSSIPELASVPGPIYLAIGVFDGVHLGHRAVLERALSEARQRGGNAVAVSFHPHPARVLRPERAPHLLTSTEHKLRLIREIGFDHILVLPFTHEFADTEPTQFIRELAGACLLREICVGHEWCFGRNREGNLALMAKLGEQLGFDEVGVPAVQIEGEVVSSTAIRRLIEIGDLAKAARLLGRPYAILGTVTRGQQLGRKLGFPTANIAAHNEQFPPNGVYSVQIRRTLKSPELWKGVANIGVRPTLANSGGERLLEVHLLDFGEDIYGEELEVTFIQFLRPEQKFPSLDALCEQIALDAARARQAFAVL